MFISHKGIAQPCGYLEISSGDIRVDGVQGLGRIRGLQSVTGSVLLQGKCGNCRYIKYAVVAEHALMNSMEISSTKNHIVHTEQQKSVKGNL